MRIALTSALLLVLAVAGLPAAAAAKDDVPDKRMYAVYDGAGRAFDVDGRIIAAMHFTEQGYGPGSRKGSYLGPFGFGDNAWSRHKKAYRKGRRPKSYPYESGRLKRCRDEHPCIFDLFDAAMAAASFLIEAGADDTLDSTGTRKALCYFNTGARDKKCDYEKRIIKKAGEYKRSHFDSAGRGGGRDRGGHGGRGKGF
jgi:hypothetical protein